MKINVNFYWNTVDEIPEHVEEPILCMTENGKLCTFKDIEKRLWKKDGSFIKYSIFENLVKNNRIKYWVYQKEITGGIIKK